MISPKNENHIKQKIANIDYDYGSENQSFSIQNKKQREQNNKQRGIYTNFNQDQINSYNIDSSSPDKYPILQVSSPIRSNLNMKERLNDQNVNFPKNSLGRLNHKQNSLKTNVINHIIESSPIKQRFWEEEEKNDLIVSKPLTNLNKEGRDLIKDSKEEGLSAIGIVSRRKKNIENSQVPGGQVNEGSDYQNTFYKEKDKEKQSQHQVMRSKYGSNNSLGKVNEVDSYNNISNTIKQNKNYEVGSKEEINSTPNYVKSINEISLNKEYESRRKKNQNNLNTLINTNNTNTNSNTNNYMRAGGGVNDLANSNFIKSDNPSSIFGIDGSRRKK